MTKATRGVDFEMQMHVTFGDEEKVKAYFIDSDWRTVFWAVDDLDDLAEMVARAVHFESEHFDASLKKFCKSPEGFGVYVLQQDGSYVLNDAGQKEIGTTITVRYPMELDVVAVYSVQETSHD